MCEEDPSCCTADWDATRASLACTGACQPTCSPGSDYCAGACTDVQTNPAHCGACGVTCTNPHGTTRCATGACQPTCSLGWGTCDSNPQNGCETSFDTNLGCPGTFLGPTRRGAVLRSGRDKGTCFDDYTSLRARLTSPPRANYNVRLTCFDCGSNLSVNASGTSCADWSLELRGDENVAPNALCAGDD